MNDLALFRTQPALAGKLARLPLCDLPTPVRPLPGLAAGLRVTGVEVWMKDDGATESVIGGNKTRILELVLPEALSRGRRLIALGPTSSNWVRAACYHGLRAGARMEAVLFRWPSGVNAPRVEAAIRADAERVRVVGTPFGIGLPLALLAACWPRDGGRGVLLPAGGSSTLGALAYASAALELAEDVHAGRCPRLDRVYVALGSGGTAAGLAAGLGMAGLDTEVVCVRVADRAIANRTHASWQARRVCRMVQRLACLDAPPTPVPIRVIHDQFGGRYGRVTPAGEAARVLASDSEGLTLDPTYCAKTVAGMLADARHRSGDTILYWHTLGPGGFHQAGPEFT